MTRWQRRQRRCTTAMVAIAALASSLGTAAAFDLEGHCGARGLPRTRWRHFVSRSTWSMDYRNLDAVAAVA